MKIEGSDFNTKDIPDRLVETLEDGINAINDTNGLPEEAPHNIEKANEQAIDEGLSDDWKNIEEEN